MFDVLEMLGLDYRKLPPWIIRLSFRVCHWRTGSPESFCSYVYANERRWWVWLLGRNHCRTCWEFWRG